MSEESPAIPPSPEGPVVTAPTAHTEPAVVPETASTPPEAKSSPTELPVIELSPSDRGKLQTKWGKVVERFGLKLKLTGQYEAPNIGRAVKYAQTFCNWAIEHGLSPDEFPESAKTQYLEFLDRSGLAPIVRHTIKKSTLAVLEEAKMKVEDPQSKSAEELPPEDDFDEVDEGTEDEQEQEPPPRRRSVAQTQQPVFVVAQQQPKQRKQYERAQPRSAVSKIIPRTEKVRVYKRGAGAKKFYVGDYSTDEIGGSLHKFLKEFVDPEFSDGTGLTTYEVYEVDPRNDADKGLGAAISIESPMTAPPDESIARARSTVELIRELRDLDAEANAGTKSVLDEVKKKAAAGSDINGLMMLMMMERLMGSGGSKNEEIALKVIEQMRKGNAPAGLDSLSVLQPLPPPPAYIPPPPPPPDTGMKDVMVKLLEAQLAPKQEKTLTDQLVEIEKLKAVLAPPQRDPELTMILKTLAEKVSQPAQVSGIDSALASFDKLTSVVKTLAPQVNMGGWTGALQNILTPTLGKAVGDMLAEGLLKAKTTAAPAHTPAPVPQRPAQTNLPPPEVIAKADALRAAATEDAAVQATLELLQAMYTAPQFTPQMEPALQALLRSDVKPGLQLVHEVIREVRADLATDAFCKRVVVGLITAVGGTPPAELIGPPAIPSVVRPEVVASAPSNGKHESAEPITTTPAVVPAVEPVTEQKSGPTA